MKTTRFLATSLAAGALALGGATLSGCGGGGGTTGSSGTAVSTIHATSSLTPVVIAERWLAYLADEATTGAIGVGTDLNANGFNGDSVASVVDMALGTTRVLGVQADDLEIIYAAANGTHLYTVTDEAKDTEWNGVAGDQIVLLHSNLELATGPTFVATLDPSGPCLLVRVADRLYFAEEAVALVAPETSIMYVDTAVPTVPVRVNLYEPVVPGADTLQPVLMGQDQGLIFLSADEVLEGRDLNGDTDLVDGDVLALLDGTDLAATIYEVPFALQDELSPVRALNIGANDWIAGFLVDEANQLPLNLTGLNDPALLELGGTWQPPQCVAVPDTDTLDEVLHYLQFSGFTVDPLTSPVVNTGLVGSDRILAAWDGNMMVSLGTVSFEGDEGGCFLNGDGDADDQVLRWLPVPLPVTNLTLPRPYTNSAQIQAIQTLPIAVPGGPGGALEFSARFICVISEAEDGRNHDADPLTDDDLIAWLDPFALAPAWMYDQDQFTAGIQAVGTGWISQRPEDDVFPVAFPELYAAGGGFDINGDGDILDSVPSWASFAPAGDELDFPGVAIAIQEDNAGVDLSRGLAFYRVDEAADSRDWNGDGDMNDMVLFRTTAATGTNTSYVGTLNNLMQSSIFRAVPINSENGIGFIADETMETGADFNGDGDSTDLVLRWMRVD